MVSLPAKLDVLKLVQQHYENLVRRVTLCQNEEVNLKHRCHRLPALTCDMTYMYASSGFSA